MWPLMQRESNEGGLRYRHGTLDLQLYQWSYGEWVSHLLLVAVCGYSVVLSLHWLQHRGERL